MPSSVPYFFAFLRSKLPEEDPTLAGSLVLYTPHRQAPTGKGLRWPVRPVVGTRVCLILGARNPPG